MAAAARGLWLVLGLPLAWALAFVWKVGEVVVGQVDEQVVVDSAGVLGLEVGLVILNLHCHRLKCCCVKQFFL